MTQTQWTIIAQVVENGETIPIADYVDAPTPAAAIERFVARYPRPVDFKNEVRSICVNATPEDVNKGKQPVARWLRKNWFKSTPDARGRWKTKVIDEVAGGFIVRAKKASEA